MDKKLLPCPFCGAKAKLRHLDYEGGQIWGVFCSKDTDDEYSHAHYIDNYPTPDKAIEAWSHWKERIKKAVR